LGTHPTVSVCPDTQHRPEAGKRMSSRPTPEAESHNRRAQGLWEEGRCDDAIQAWREGHALEPDHVGTLLNLAWALARLGRVAEALPLGQQAVQLSPGDWHAHHALGHVHYQAGRFAEAAAEYSEAVEAGGTDPLLHCDLGDALYSEGRFAEAATAYSATVAEEPEDAYAHLWLGWSLHQLAMAGASAPAQQDASRVGAQHAVPLHARSYDSPNHLNAFVLSTRSMVSFEAPASFSISLSSCRRSAASSAPSGRWPSLP